MIWSSKVNRFKVKFKGNNMTDIDSIVMEWRDIGKASAMIAYMELGE